jgi:hypothetical protein
MAIDSNDAPVKVPSLYLTPEMFLVGGNRIGDGANDDAILTAWANACNTLGLEAHGSPGATYNCSSALTLTICVPFSGNGAIFSVPNDGQGNALFIFESLATDIETVSKATVNTWTGLTKGSFRIPQLTEKEWVYNFISTDQVFIPRSNGLGGQPYGETIVATDNLGYLAAPLVRTYTTPFSDVTCTRRKLRDWATVEDLRVHIIDGTLSLMNKVVQCLRPRTIFKGCSIYNDSGDYVQQGFVATNTAFVLYDSCSCFGLEETSTEYCFTSGFAHQLLYRNCSAGQSRRNLDATGSTYIAAEDCDFPNGAGGHWIDYLALYRCRLGHRNNTNPHPIHVSGSNVKAIDCDIFLGACGPLTNIGPQAFNMRSDLPELSGYAIIKGGSITIDGNALESSKAVELMKFNGIDTFDYGRTIKQPDYILFAPDVIHQIGASCQNSIGLVSLGANKTAAQMPNSVSVDTTVEIRPGKIILEGGQLTGASAPRLSVTYNRGETQIGAGANISVKNVETVFIFSAPTSATVPDSTGRASFLIEDAGPLSKYEFRYGATKSARLRRCAQVGTNFARTVVAPAFKDESIDYEDFGENHDGLLLNPFGAIIQRGSNINVGDAAYAGDGWIALTQGASVNFAVAANSLPNVPFISQFQQKDASPAKIGTLSFISANESIALRDRLVTLVAKILSSTALTINYAIGEWTGAANAPTRDVVNNWASGSFTPGGFFINTTTNILATGVLSSTTSVQEISLPAHVGTSCNNLWIMFWTDSQIAQDAYFRVAADLYPGFYRPLLRRRSDTDERQRCSAFYQSRAVTAINGKQFISFTPEFIKTPTPSATVGTTSGVTVDGVLLTHTVDGAASTVVMAADI